MYSSPESLSVRKRGDVLPTIDEAAILVTGLNRTIDPDLVTEFASGKAHENTGSLLAYNTAMTAGGRKPSTKSVDSSRSR
jgi:hypothetical protein